MLLPEGHRVSLPVHIQQPIMSSRKVHGYPAADSSGVKPASTTILRVILGFVLFSSWYPGVEIVHEKKQWTSVPYRISPERKLSASPTCNFRSLQEKELKGLKNQPFVHVFQAHKYLTMPMKPNLDDAKQLFPVSGCKPSIWRRPGCTISDLTQFSVLLAH